MNQKTAYQLATYKVYDLIPAKTTIGCEALYRVDKELRLQVDLLVILNYRNDVALTPFWLINHLYLFSSMDIMLRAFWRSGNFKNTRRWIRGRVLLTGATGFLGVFLLRDLIRLTKVLFYLFLISLCRETYSKIFRFFFFFFFI